MATTEEDDLARRPTVSIEVTDGDDPYIGRIFGERYQVISKLGEGSQARVYLARHVLIDRLVAVKFLMPVLAVDKSLVGRFLNEGRAAGSLGHANIVESLDMGFAPDGAPYLVLELLNGRTLAEEIIATGPLPPRRAAYIACQIASALSAAHARNIVHRDLKPANVLLVERHGKPDQVKVLDFGISKFSAGGSRVKTITGQQLGTPGFMAPEQIEDPENIDSRADVYGLGATLYDMLAGIPPFADVGFPKVLRLIVEETPRPLAEIRPDLPAGLVAIVECAMSKSPADRFQTMEHFAYSMLPFVDEPPSFREPVRSVAPLPSTVAPRAPPPSASRSPGASTEVVVAEAPSKRKKKLLLLALGFLAGLLTAVLVFRPSAPARPPEGPAHVREEPAASPRAPVAMAPTVSPSEPAAPSAEGATSAAQHSPASRHPALPHVTRVTAHPPPKVESAPLPTESTNCNPPFYYEGKKKLFKAGCI